MNFRMDLAEQRRQICNAFVTLLKLRARMARSENNHLDANQYDDFVVVVKDMQERIDFLEARNGELQVNNEQQRQRAIAAEKVYLQQVWGQPKDIADTTEMVNTMLSEASDYFAATLAKADDAAWRQLLTYCPFDIIYARYVNRIRADSVSPDVFEPNAAEQTTAYILSVEELAKRGIPIPPSMLRLPEVNTDAQAERQALLEAAVSSRAED